VAVYSIKDLEKLTGIKAHTIRIWEVRYGLITPARTQSNIRFYTDLELKTLFNIALLNKNGYKISKIALLTKEQISEKVSSISENNFEHASQLDALTLAMIDMDEAKFDRIISQNIKELGFERVMLEVLYPFLDKLNLLWLTGSVSPAHENFIGNLIRQKIIVAIEQASTSTHRDARSFLLFLPEGELQELSLLFMYFLVKTRKNRVIYLGQHNSLSDVRDVCQSLNPDYVFTIINDPMPRQPIQLWLEQLHAQMPHTHFLLTGQQFFSQPVKPPTNTTLFRSLFDMIHFLDHLPTR
jgi:MerR family transcriptional regulator, light-induced transcriptional regulator